jgi:hypothetical protein
VEGGRVEGWKGGRVEGLGLIVDHFGLNLFPGTSRSLNSETSHTPHRILTPYSDVAGTSAAKL